MHGWGATHAGAALSACVVLRLRGGYLDDVEPLEFGLGAREIDHLHHDIGKDGAQPAPQTTRDVWAICRSSTRRATWTSRAP